ncbi:MAG: C1 family peptidase [Flavobacteriales bacterium]
MFQKSCLYLFFLLLVANSPAQGQTPDYQFTDIVRLDPSPVKDQCRTGTCWSYSTTSFLESEIQRQTGQTLDLSEMFNVRMTYPEKAEMYLRLHGLHQFGPGSLNHDVLHVLEHHGVVPESVYSGLPAGETFHDHGHLDALLLGMVEVARDRKWSVSDPVWNQALAAVLDVYLGAVPETFDVNGETHTPLSYRDALGLDANKYVSLTSFTHHPYEASFVLEIPDNFARKSFWNVELDQLEKAVTAALDRGYTVAWDADVSERGFDFRLGLAVLLAKGEELSDEQVLEPAVTAASRQMGFDDFSTTDDHLMHIVGYANDQDGDLFFIVKNSWGGENLFGGYQYVSLPYFRAKTISILLHENGLPKGTIRKM